MGEVMKYLEILGTIQGSMKALDYQRTRMELEQNRCLRVKFFFKILFGAAFCHCLVFVGVS